MGGLKSGIISISIDATQISDDPAVVSIPSAAGPLEELIDCFTARSIPATWAFSDPSRAAIACRQLTDFASVQEIALLLDRRNSEMEISRSEIARCIAQPIQDAAAAGLSVSSLVARGKSVEQHVDLLAKHGITMICAHNSIVRSPRSQHRAHQFAGTLQLLRYGLWHIPMTHSISGGNWLECLRQSTALRRAITRLSKGQGGLFHIRIDAASTSHGKPARTLRMVIRLVKQVDRLRAAGRIEVLNLRGIAQRLAPKRCVAAKSILRAA